MTRKQKKRLYRILAASAGILLVELLPVDGRPVSQSTDLRQLYEARRATYAACADFTVDNTGTPEQAAED